MARPALAGDLISAGLAALYAVLVIRVPPALGATFALLSAAGLFVIAVHGAIRARLASRLLRRLGPQAPSKALLSEAVGEVAKAADRVFWSGVQGFAVVSLTIALVMRYTQEGVDWTLALRIAGLGLLFGPLGSLFAYLFTTFRARELLEKLALAGLSAQEMLALLPPKRMQIRARLVVFTAVLVIVPAILTADTASLLSKRAVAQVEAEQGAAAKQVAALSARQEAMAVVGVLGGLVFLTTLAAAYAMGTILSRPMRKVAAQAKRIADGELGRVQIIPAEDEVWAVSSAFTTLQAHLTEVLSKLKGAGVRIGATTEQIVATTRRYESGAAAQAGALNETSATTEELARSARQIAGNGSSVAKIAQSTLSAAQAGQLTAEAFAGSVARICNDNQAISDAVLKLSKRVQQIGKIVEFINGVADRSDLLALSAELEGTKAGEVGRGFSLVAGEMRRLAENVLESTREIEELIEEIRTATQAAAAATEGGVKATEVGAALADQVSESLGTIVTLAGKTSDAVRAISLSTQQQQTGTDQLAEAMGDILAVTQGSLEATKQVGAANSGLSALAKDLQGVVERFRIEE